MLSQFLYWQSPENGLLKGTIVCQDGHVHLTDIPPDDTQRYEDLVRDFANSCERLPFTVEQATVYLDEQGLPRVDLNPPLVFFGPKPAPSELPLKAPKQPDILKLTFVGPDPETP